MKYKAIEVVPEEFYAVINRKGKNYHFTAYTNAVAIKAFAKWGDKSMGAIIAEAGEAAYIGTIAFWLLSPEERKDFKDENDFNEKVEPYYANKADLSGKVLRAMSIGMIPTEDEQEAAISMARFSKTTDTEARGIYRKAAKPNIIERLLHISPKPKTNANKAV
jgi:hypothetical protein